MDERQSGKRLVRLSPSAAQDLAGIYTYTTQSWGYDQAERYTDLLETTAQEAAQPAPLGAKELEDRPGYFAILVKWPGA